MDNVDCIARPGNCTGTPGNDDIRNGYNVSANSGNDMVFAVTGAPNKQYGQAGQDYLEGGSAGTGDSLNGGPGNDYYSCSGRPCGPQGGGGLDVLAPRQDLLALRQQGW